MNVALPPTCFTRVLSTALEIAQPYVRVKVGVADFVTVRSAPTQTFTVWLAEPVVPFVFVVKVAVLLCVVHVPAASPLKLCEYVKNPEAENVRGACESSGSLTLTLLSTCVVGSPHVIDAVAGAVPALRRVALERVCSAHEMVAVFVWFALACTAEYVHA